LEFGGPFEVSTAKKKKFFVSNWKKGRKKIKRFSKVGRHRWSLAVNFILFFSFRLLLYFWLIFPCNIIWACWAPITYSRCRGMCYARQSVKLWGAFVCDYSGFFILCMDARLHQRPALLWTERKLCIWLLALWLCFVRTKKKYIYRFIGFDV
jgi:hypothetical protein